MKKAAIYGLFFLSLPASLRAMDLQQYLNEVQNKHRGIQSYTASQEAAEDRRLSGDIDLVPMLTAGAGYLNDKSPLGQFAQLGATQTEGKDFKLGLGKRFSTGTNISVFAGASEIENQGTLSVPAFQKFSYGSLGVTLSQSLWKDSFGYATRLRWLRQDAVAEAEVGRFDLQKKVLLVEAEAAYWDYVYLQENLKISQASLERAKRIESWTRRRVNDGISDRADLYSSQALVAARQLQLVSAQDDMAAVKKRVRDFLELREVESMPEISGNISQPRTLNSVIEGSKSGRVVALDTYMASLKAKTSAVLAKETDNAYAPDVILSGAYSTNNFALNTTLSEATKSWSDNGRPTWKVGLNVVYMFDTSIKDAARSAVRKDALAAQLQSDRKQMESESQWLELNRRYSEMNKRIENASVMVRLQLQAAKSQTELFNKGRSITASVITAEENAGAAELNLAKLKAEQRKMEAQGRLFVVVEEK